MLVGVTVDGSTSVLNQARFAFGCLARPVYQRLLTQNNITLVSSGGHYTSRARSYVNALLYALIR